MTMNQKGFTLIEFVVIISIFAIMASVALFNFTGFRSNVGINNVTQDIALTIRQAQVFGWSTQTFSIDPAGDILRYPHGVHFKMGTNNEFENEIILYTKTDPQPANAFYEEGLDTEVEKLQVLGNMKISDIRAANTKDELLIDKSSGNKIIGGVSLGTDISIAFSRPRPEVMLFAKINLIQDQFVGIYVASTDTCPNVGPCNTADRVVLISRFGEIEVQ